MDRVPSSTPCVYILVPVLNEAANLPRLTTGFRDTIREFSGAYRFHVVLVDDGSTDETASQARQHLAGIEATVLTHPKNLGPGRAFGTAFEYLAPRLAADDWVVTMEGDNTSRVELLRQMFTRTREGYDVILASPYMYGGGLVQTNAIRLFLSHVANAFIKEALGIHGIVTMSSFFRLSRGSVILELQKWYGPRILDRTGFECMIEWLLKMIHLKAQISEVPMLLDGSRRLGKSKMKVLRTIVGYLTIWMEKRKWLRVR